MSLQAKAQPSGSRRSWRIKGILKGNNHVTQIA